MSDLVDYILSFLPHLWPLLTAGTLFGFDTFARSYWPWAQRQLDRVPERVRSNIELFGVLLAMFYAGFAAWDQEYTAKNQEHAARVNAEDQQAKPRDQERLIERLSADLAAARGQIDALVKERETEHQSRHLSDIDKQNLIKVFTPLASQFATLKVSAPSDGEAQGYADEFRKVFNSIGIKVDRIGFIIPTSSLSVGLEVVVKDLTHPPRKSRIVFCGIGQGGVYR